MTEKHPDFTDVFYANARVKVFAKKGLRLQEAGDHKGARAAYKEALRWEKEAKRFDRLVKGKSKRRGK